MAAELTVDSLQAYLRGRGLDATVDGLRRIGGGASRETWLVDLSEPVDPLPRLLLLRRDLPDGATVPTSLRREFDMLSGLFAGGVPVARPYFFEADDSRFGSPFYVRQGFEGVSDQSRFTGEPARRLAVGLAEALAVLHRVDPSVIGSAVPASIDQALAEEIERWYGGWLERTDVPAPFLTEVTWWLRRNRPSVAAGPSVVWGDVGVANTICSPAGDVLALSDFELTGWGDPMRDVASALWRGVGDLAGRDTFLDAYRAASGRTVDEQRIRYYDVFFNWQVGMFCHTAATRSAGTHRSLHPALLQLWAHHMNLHKAGRHIGV